MQPLLAASALFCEILHDSCSVPGILVVETYPPVALLHLLAVVVRRLQPFMKLCQWVR
jgi:hypothetical protein